MVVVPPGLISSGETLTRNVGLAAALGNAKIPTKTATVTATPATLTVPCRNSIQSTTPALSLIRTYGTLRIFFLKQPEPLPSAMTKSNAKIVPPSTRSAPRGRLSALRGAHINRIPDVNSRKHSSLALSSFCSEVCSKGYWPPKGCLRISPAHSRRKEVTRA